MYYDYNYIMSYLILCKFILKGSVELRPPVTPIDLSSLMKGANGNEGRKLFSWADDERDRQRMLLNNTSGVLRVTSANKEMK